MTKLGILLQILSILCGSVFCRNRYRECKQSQLGAEYTGLVNVTTSGKTCQRWDTTSPHSHSWTDQKFFPDFSMEEAGNNCRNPDKEGRGPWCYTTDPSSRYEFCDVPDCSTYPECKITESGGEYRGYISQTRTGETCRNWNLQNHDYQQKESDSDSDTDENYCRNPDSKPEGPWCWTSETEWDYCDIKFCKPSASCKNINDGTNYVGTVSVTQSGHMCQRWDRQAPHSHSFTSSDSFPDASMDEAANFCRNPDTDEDVPWCFTIDPNVRWERCDIPTCPDCITTSTGREYAGLKSTTADNIPCQRWDSQSPHPHNMTDIDRFPDANFNEASNYCRNPDNKATGPWCYTTDNDARWASCNIAQCDSGCENKPPLRQRAKHVVHVGVDGLRPDCISLASGGAPTFLQRLPQEGTHTLTLGRTTWRTVSMPGWGSTVCGMPIESTGIRGNGWSPPWMGGNEAITPITGKDVPMPCGFAHLKAKDATIATAAYYAWSNFRDVFNTGIPKSADFEMYCTSGDSTGHECDDWLTQNVTEYIGQITKSSHSSYTFLHLDSIDHIGHSSGWCSDAYGDAINRMDDRIADILDAIDAAEGGADNILFMLSADHGGSGFGHGGESDTDLFVPMYLRGPSIRKQYEFKKEVRVQDLVPTGLYALGVEQNPYMKGLIMNEAFED